MLYLNDVPNTVFFTVMSFYFFGSIIFVSCHQSLAVGHAEVEGLSRITTVVPGTDESISKLVQQLHKLVDLHEVRTANH